MKNKKKDLILIYLLLVVVGITLVPLNKIFIRKSVSEPFNNQGRISSAYDLPKNSLDILFVGSSHAYTSVNPNQVYQETGIKSFVMASQQQSVAMSYYHIREILRNQRPKVVAFNTYMINRSNGYNEAITRDAIEYMEFSFNKLNMINDLVPHDERAYYYFPILKYHSRWTELSAIDFSFIHELPKSESLGFVPLNKSSPQLRLINENTNYDNNAASIDPGDLFYLEKIKELSQTYGFTLVMYNVPYIFTNESVSVNHAVKKYAYKNNIKFYDYFRKIEIFNFDYEKDYYDAGHLNKYGAEKFTAIFVSELLNDLEDSLHFNRERSYYYDCFC